MNRLIMESSQIDAQHLARYLSGELNAMDEEAFEEYVARNPEVYREVEVVLRMKEGLAALHDSGKLEYIIRKRRRWPSTALAAAAALITLTLGIWVWRDKLPPSVPILANSPLRFVDAIGRSMVVSSRYVLIQSREPTVPLELRLTEITGAIEIRILPSTFIPLGRYRAGLKRIETGKSSGFHSYVGGLQPADDRYVTIYLDGTRIAPGDYEISLLPDGSKQPDVETDRFAVRVR
jgi:hypothetical protein